MPPIPKFAQVLAKRARAKPKAISGIPAPHPILLINSIPADIYTNLSKNFNQVVGLNLCNNPDNKALLKEFLEKIYTAYSDNEKIASRISSTLLKIDNVSNENNLLVLINKVKLVYKALKTLDQTVPANKDITAKMKRIRDALEVEYYHIINNSEATTKIVRDYQIEKTIDLPCSTIPASYSSTKDSVNQFTHDGNWTPTVQDIKQGFLNDCYLLAALLALIESGNIDVIKRCFVGSSSNKVTLRFFKLKVIAKEKVNNSYIYKIIPTGKVEITINKSILVNSRNQSNIANQTNAVWVNLFEKAFTIYKNNKNYVVCGDTAISPYKSKPFVDGWYSRNKTSLPPDKVASVQDINNGYGAIAMTAITGKTAKFTELSYDRNLLGKKFPDSPMTGSTNRYHDRANKLYEMFDKKLKKGNIITVNTRASTFKKLPAAVKTIWEVKPPPPHIPKSHPSLMPDHAYAMVTSVEEDTDHYKYINLRNPHMGDSVDYRVSPTASKRIRTKIPGAEKGKLRMELNDFIKYFGYYEIGKVNKEI